MASTSSTEALVRQLISGGSTMNGSRRIEDVAKNCYQTVESSAARPNSGRVKKTACSNALLIDGAALLTGAASILESGFKRGDVVYAKVEGFSMWPGIIDEDMYCSEFMDEQQHPVYARFYHVIFFGSKPSRDWVEMKRIQPFLTGHDPNRSVTQRKKKLFRPSVSYSKAVQQATSAASLIDVHARLKQFGSASVWHELTKVKAVNGRKKRVMNVLRKIKAKQKQEISDNASDSEFFSSAYDTDDHERFGLPSEGKHISFFPSKVFVSPVSLQIKPDGEFSKGLRLTKPNQGHTVSSRLKSTRSAPTRGKEYTLNVAQHMQSLASGKVSRLPSSLTRVKQADPLQALLPLFNKLFAAAHTISSTVTQKERRRRAQEQMLSMWCMSMLSLLDTRQVDALFRQLVDTLPTAAMQEGLSGASEDPHDGADSGVVVPSGSTTSGSGLGEVDSAYMDVFEDGPLFTTARKGGKQPISRDQPLVKRRRALRQ